MENIRGMIISWLIIDRKAGEVISLVVTIFLCVCVFKMVSPGYHLAECRCAPLGQVPFMKIRNLVHFADEGT